MNHKEVATDLYALDWRPRQKLLKEIPKDDRWQVQAYIDQMAKRDQIANSRRNAVKAGFSLPRKGV